MSVIKSGLFSQNIFHHFVFLLLLILVSESCNNETTETPTSTDQKLFKTIDSGHSGITFSNQLTESQNINYYKYPYLFNGSGVGIADINNDGLQDAYFTSTQGAEKLYLNKGNMQFEDISAAAGIAKYTGYKTGVTFVDINLDGWQDIYVCRSGWSTDPNEKKESTIYQ